MSDYKAPLNDISFVLNDVFNIQAHYDSLGLDVDADFVQAVLDEGAKFTRNEFAPINRAGDEEGAKFDQGTVTTPSGFKQAYRNYCEGGWSSIIAPAAFGGQDLPNSLATPFFEMCNATNLSLRMYPALTEGNVLALDKHGSAELKQTYLAKLISGEWTGTMCLTEPHAGTDLGLLKTKATPTADGAYQITGTKIFISAGEHDLSENIVHLVLAKLPDAPKGSKGISLFLVPKFLPDGDGLGARNSVSCGSLEHKMGLKASATAVMNFDDAKGWLVGGEHQGLACMFTMMNDARFNVGIQGLGLSQMAFQGGLDYATERLQSRSLSGVKSPNTAADPIIVHPDVRRMLLAQKALNEGCRALSYFTATLLDIERFEQDPNKHKDNEGLLAFFIPIVKAFVTDVAQEVTSLGVQIYGGHGYIREWGMEQLMRDARILPIYEGTNGIQALDFIGRKNLHNNGEVLHRFINDAEAFCDQAQYVPAQISTLKAALQEWRALFALIQNSVAREPEEIGAVSVDFLSYSAYVSVAYFWAKMANVAAYKLEKQMGDQPFYEAKLHTAEFYFGRILPRAQSHKQALLSGANNLMAMTPEQFAAF